MAEDVDKLAEVEHPHLLQVLPLLVGSGRTDHGKDGRREAQRGERKSEGGGGHKHGWNRCDVERSWHEQTESQRREQIKVDKHEGKKRASKGRVGNICRRDRSINRKKNKPRRDTRRVGKGQIVMER